MDDETVKELGKLVREWVIEQLGDPVYMAQMNAESPLEIVLRGQLWIEGELTMLIRTALPFPQHLDFSRMHFATKISLGAALSALPPDTHNALKALNKLRNTLAHDHLYELSVVDEQTLLNAMPPYGQEAIMAAEGSGAFPAKLRLTLAYLLGMMVSMRRLSQHLKSEPIIEKREPS